MSGRDFREDLRAVDGLTTHALVWGEHHPHAPPVVIVPGIGCAAFMYAPLARSLARHAAVWAYDPPGHGRSAARRGDHLTITRLSDHLAAWLRAANLSGATIVGHSLGGEVAIDLAARHPHVPGRLVLLAPTGLPDNPNVLLQFLRLWADAPLEPPGLLFRAWAAYWRPGLKRLYAIAADQREHRTAPLLRRVRVPVLVVEGRHDPAIPRNAIDTLCARIPSARAEVSPGAHAFFYGHPDLVAGFVHDFVRSTWVPTDPPSVAGRDGNTR